MIQIIHCIIPTICDEKKSLFYIHSIIQTKQSIVECIIFIFYIIQFILCIMQIILWSPFI